MNEPEVATTPRELIQGQRARLRQVLAEALEESSPERRRTRLKQSCGEDSALLHVAERLLACPDDDFDQFAELASIHLRNEETGRIGQRVGAYSIVRELGRGGMGAVYLAQRADGQFQKQVAIKILKRGTDTEEVIRRFQMERQILANLDHSNITRLLDAGVTSDGLPYFIMEYVDGTPLTHFVEQRGLDLRQRLELFLNVCSAVELAHQNQVIHRDLKPSNILVKPNGEPKLLDFGIAKLVSSDERDITVTAERRLTPVYASPEQVAGDPLTVRTDVYSLGALLYQLVTQRRPPSACDRDSSPPERFVPPRSAVRGPKLRRQLRGHLDSIIHRAMRREPLDRYSSAANLAADVKGYLNGVAPSTKDNSKMRAIGKSPPRWTIVAAVAGVALFIAGFFWLWPNLPLPGKSAGRPSDYANAAGEKIHSIAILPFEPLGRDRNDELLGLGMADAVIGRMSRMKQLSVLPTSAVSKYQGPARDPIAAGHALGVDAIINGTVQRSGDRVRVTAQLVSTHSGRALWSDKFDQTFTDIFGIQDSISDNLARSLTINLTNEEQKQLAKHNTSNTAAYDSYLMGLYFYNKRSKEGLEKAVEYLQQAAEKDPAYALAYALKSDCYFLQFYYRYSSEPREVIIGKAKTAADRALQLDDSLAEGHLADAMVKSCQMNGPGWMESLQRAIQLNPNLAVAHQRLAWALSNEGRLGDAVREMRRAQELDPLSPTNNTALGISLVFARQYREAVDYCYKAAELAPNLAPTQSNLAFAYVLNGMCEQAIERFQKVGELDPDGKGDALASIAIALVFGGRKSEADLMMPEILALATAGKADPYTVTQLYAARGEKDAAFEWFDKALQRGAEKQTNGNDPKMIRYDPMLDPLRSDGRFALLLRRHNRASLLEVSSK